MTAETDNLSRKLTRIYNGFLKTSFIIEFNQNETEKSFSHPTINDQTLILIGVSANPTPTISQRNNDIITFQRTTTAPETHNFIVINTDEQIVST